MIRTGASIVDARAGITAPPAAASHRVAVLLCTLNGERHLKDQLESIATQTFRDWSLWISDDGSTDATLDVISAFERQHPKIQVTVKSGPRAGFAANYLKLIKSPEIDAEFFAFCDQDDIWLPHRLETSTFALMNQGPAQPALYCTRTEYINDDGERIGESRPLPASASFESALAQNVCGGNTMLLNKEARNLICQLADDDASAHDWLAYLLVTGVGGTVVLDQGVSVRYRQHTGNSMGENQSLRAQWSRLRQVLNGDLRRWTDCNLLALSRVEHMLTPHSRGVLERFALARKAPASKRLPALRASGVHRNGRASNLAYRVAMLFGLV